MAELYHFKQVQSAFSRAAEHYDAHADLQHEVLQRTYAEAKHYFTPKMRLLDIGCGTGRFAHMASACDWHIMQLDVAFGMCKKARDHGIVVNADAHALPFAEASFDGIFSNLALQWFNHPKQALQEMHRLLKRGGKCVITGFGPATLQELRQALMRVDGTPRFNTFFPRLQLAEMAHKAGFEITACREEMVIKHYPKMIGLMRHIKAIGASNKLAGRTVGTRRLFDDAAKEYEMLRTPQGLPARWEVITLVLKK